MPLARVAARRSQVAGKEFCMDLNKDFLAQGGASFVIALVAAFIVFKVAKKLIAAVVTVVAVLAIAMYIMTHYFGGA
jgi:hypothetical protein